MKTNAWRNIEREINIIVKTFITVLIVLISIPLGYFIIMNVYLILNSTWTNQASYIWFFIIIWTFIWLSILKFIIELMEYRQKQSIFQD